MKLLNPVQKVRKWVWFIGVLLCAFPEAEGGVEVPLAREGKALLSVVVASGASEEVTALAWELANGLTRITGAKFEVKTGELSDAGIMVGTDAMFPDKLPAGNVNPKLAREDYLLKTEEGRVLLVGRTELAVQNAVWDFFYRAGYRHFFPAQKWEIWPENANLSVNFDHFEQPDYFTRELSNARSARWSWKENFEDTRNWKKHNRLVSGFELKTGHAYGSIMKRKREELEAHREYLADEGGGENGIGGNAKFDPSHEGLLKLVLEDTLEQLRNVREKGDDKDSISMDPSDGGHWRKDSPLGSVSNQAVTLANYVARGIQEEFPGTKVGMYAYNEHSPAPTIDVAPNVIVSVATAFIRGGFTANQLVESWAKKGAEIGIREYLATSVWVLGLPGRGNAADFEYLGTTIADFYANNARYYITDAEETWMAYGLGFYLTSRFLWDVEEYARLEELLSDFFVRSFGKAAPEMRAFHERFLYKNARALFSEDMLGRMYCQLERALAKETDAMVLSRIEDYILYTRFLELSLDFQTTNGEKQVAAYEELAKFAYRNRRVGIVGRGSVMLNLPLRHAKIGKPELEKMIASFERLEPTEADEIRKLLTEGVANNVVNSFETVAFSNDLVPLHPGMNADVSDFGDYLTFRGKNVIYLYTTKEGTEFRFRVIAGNIYGNRGPVQFELYADENALVGTPVDTGQVVPDKEPHEIVFQSLFPGLHRLEFKDGGDSTKIAWPVGQYAAVPVSPDLNQRFQTNNKEGFVFYVPEASASVSGFTTAKRRNDGKIVDQIGTTVLDFKKLNGPEFFSIPLEDGMAALIWRIQSIRSGERWNLLTVPPFLSRSEEELLVPREVLRGNAKEMECSPKIDP